MKTNQRYMLVQDNDLAWYMIPAENLMPWNSFLVKSYEYDATLACPPWARPVQGSASKVTFENPRVS